MPITSSHALQPLPKARGQFPRHPRAKFTLLFLVYCVLILAMYRSSTFTISNQAYLFSVAQCTAAVLRAFGIYTEVESVATYAGRESEVRRVLASTGGFPAAHANTDPLGRIKPITAWEVYLFRMHRIRDELLEIERAKAQLEKPFFPVVVHSPEEHVRVMEERLNQVRNPIYMTKNQRLLGAIDSADRDELRTIADTIETARTLASVPTEKFVQMLQDADQRLDRLRIRLAKSFRNQADRLQNSLSSLGPTVYLRRPPQDPIKSPFVFSIAPECGAVEVFALYIAGVLAMPCARKKHFTGILVGLPLLYFVNVLRLAALGYIGLRYANPEMFRFVHEYVWQGIYVVFAASVWLGWTEYVVKTRPTVKPGTRAR